MQQLFAAFGIDGRLLLINGINFGLLLAALWYFLYKPLTNMLEARRQKMIEGVHAASEADKRLQEIEGSRAEVLAQAGLQADEVLSLARKSGGEKQRELVAQGEATQAALIKEAGQQAEELKNQAIAESKQEVAKLIILGMERVALEKTI